ncbi:unnamed protein product [Urochloa decumbens]|uniref:Uncharacterized protein n=1 Tax=Urochloa decumbens TaxID=240449 RepID=A0ABC9CLV0_9POAL
MPCCQTLLTAAAAAASGTPSWLHRLHAKEGLSFPSHLNIDDLLYGGRQPQPPPPPTPPVPPPPPSSNHQTNLAVTVREPPPKAAAKPKQPQQQPRPPRNPARPNPSSSNSPPPLPELQLAAVISDVFAVPSSAPPGTPPPKAFRKQSRPRPRTDDDQPIAALPPAPRPHKEKKEKIAKAKKRRRAERAAEADGERTSRTDVTVIDTSIDGWNAAKVLIRRGDIWKVRDKKPSAVSELEDAIAKGKRRAGLVSKLQRDKEKEKLNKEKEATTSGYIQAGGGDVTKESDDSDKMLLVLNQSQKAK